MSSNCNGVGSKNSPELQRATYHGIDVTNTVMWHARQKGGRVHYVTGQTGDFSKHIGLVGDPAPGRHKQFALRFVGGGLMSWSDGQTIDYWVQFDHQCPCDGVGNRASPKLVRAAYHNIDVTGTVSQQARWKGGHVIYVPNSGQYSDFSKHIGLARDPAYGVHKTFELNFADGTTRRWRDGQRIDMRVQIGHVCSDAEAGKCAGGTFTDGTECKPCPIGHKCVGQATQPVPCPAGTASGGGSSSVCSPCPAGSYSAVGAAQCAKCQPGEFSEGTGNSDCESCPAGTFNQLEGAEGAASSTECRPCDKGSFNPTPGGVQCLACEEGTYSDLAGAETCTDCEEGTFSVGTGNEVCTECPAGTYNLKAKSTSRESCQSCPAGTASAAVGLGEECPECGQGTYSPTTGGATECTPCQKGTYNELTRQDTCRPCGKGTFNLNEASTSPLACEPCAAGTASAAIGRTDRCPACQGGWYSPAPGAETCSQCDADTFSPTQGSTACLSCPGATAGALTCASTGTGGSGGGGGTTAGGGGGNGGGGSGVSRSSTDGSGSSSATFVALAVLLPLLLVSSCLCLLIACCVAARRRRQQKAKGRVITVSGDYHDNEESLVVPHEQQHYHHHHQSHRSVPRPESSTGTTRHLSWGANTQPNGVRVTTDSDFYQEASEMPHHQPKKATKKKSSSSRNTNHHQNQHDQRKQESGTSMSMTVVRGRLYYVRELEEIYKVHKPEQAGLAEQVVATWPAGQEEEFLQKIRSKYARKASSSYRLLL